MTRRFTSLLLIPAAMWLAPLAAIAAESAPDASPQASLDDLSFLSGKWTTKKDTNTYTLEDWGHPDGDSMVGHCRFVQDGHTTYYELLAISKTQKGLVLRVRHFDGDLEPFTDENDAGNLPATSVVKGESAVFENKKLHHAKVIYKKIDDNNISVSVEDTHKGKPETFAFNYHRAD